MEDSRTSLSVIRKERFALVPSMQGRSLHIEFSGMADLSATATLPLFFNLVHREVQRQGVHDVVVGMKDLTFMNSSCLKAFVKWIDAIDSCEDAFRYRLRFVCNPKHGWQRRSLETLKSMSDGSVFIDYLK
jgi:hypothetical protein